MYKLIDGKQTAETILEELKVRVAKCDNEHDVPGLGVILAGSDAASHTYVNSKVKKCRAVGVHSRKLEYPDNVTEKELLHALDIWNEDKNIHGILVQLPLPKGLNEEKILNHISPEKDVDGFLAPNMGKVLLGQEGIKPCTPKGIFELLKRYQVPTVGASCVVVGRSNIVGKPIAAMMMQSGIDSTVTVCHSKTKNLKEICLQADILIAAIGRPHFITFDMVKEGAALIDVGINRTEQGLVGDIDFNACKDKAGWITPVPGGVGPMTIAMLLTNCIENYNHITGKNI